MEMNPYLTFKDNCEKAFKYYEKHLGGKILMTHRFKDSPMADQAPPGHENDVMHMRMELAGGVLMGSDSCGQPFNGNHGFSLSLTVHSVAEAERAFNALCDNGQVIMPLAETFWAERFGMLTDQFGIPWMVNFEKAPA